MIPGLIYENGELRVDLEIIRVSATKGVLRASAFMGYALNAAKMKELKEFNLREQNIQFVPSDLGEDQIENFKSEFSDWVVQNALRELSESFGQMLNTAYAACLVIGNPIRFDQWQLEVRKFMQMGEQKRFKHFCKKFDIELQTGRYMESLMNLRNEITHGWGVVRIKELKLCWLRHETILRGEDGLEISLQDAIDQQYRTPCEMSVILKAVEGVRTFLQGEKISLTGKQANEICLSTLTSIEQVIAALTERCARSGILVQA